MNLSLITPASSEFIKNFPSNNEINCDRIDAYAKACLTSHPLKTYTPVLTASTTNPILGTGGVLLGYYYEIFNQIYTWGAFSFGTGFDRGVGSYDISIPFQAKVTSIVGGALAINPIPVGTGLVYDLSDTTQRQPVTANLRTSTLLTFQVRMGSAGASRRVGDFVPITFAQGDGIIWSARYQRL